MPKIPLSSTGIDVTRIKMALTVAVIAPPVVRQYKLFQRNSEEHPASHCDIPHTCTILSTFASQFFLQDSVAAASLIVISLQDEPTAVPFLDDSI